MTKIQTRYLPEVQKKRLHPDFIKNEQQYWRMRDQLLKQYQGKWVAVHQGQVVAVSQDIFNITDQVGELGCHAYIAKVGEEDKVVFQVRRKDFAYDLNSSSILYTMTALRLHNLCLSPDSTGRSSSLRAIVDQDDGRCIVYKVYTMHSIHRGAND